MASQACVPVSKTVLCSFGHSVRHDETENFSTRGVVFRLRSIVSVGAEKGWKIAAVKTKEVTESGWADGAGEVEMAPGK